MEAAAAAAVTFDGTIFTECARQEKEEEEEVARHDHDFARAHGAMAGSLAGRVSEAVLAATRPKADYLGTQDLEGR